MLMPGRQGNVGDYRFAFNGKEFDPEVAGTGNQYDYGFRIYNPRIGKFLSVDTLTRSYPMLTPYQFASNTPIAAIDLDGLEKRIVISGKDNDGKLQVDIITDRKVIEDLWYAFSVAEDVEWKEGEWIYKNWTMGANANATHYPNVLKDKGVLWIKNRDSKLVASYTGWKNDKADDFSIFVGGADASASYVIGGGFTLLGTSKISEDELVWEVGRSLNYIVLGSNIGTPGADFSMGLGKLNVLQLKDHSLTKTLNESWSSSSSIGGGYYLGGKYYVSQGYAPNGEKTFTINIPMVSVVTPGAGGTTSTSNTPSVGRWELKGEPMTKEDSMKRANELYKEGSRHPDVLKYRKKGGG